MSNSWRLFLYEGACLALAPLPASLDPILPTLLPRFPSRVFASHPCSHQSGVIKWIERLARRRCRDERVCRGSRGPRPAAAALHRAVVPRSARGGRRLAGPPARVSVSFLLRGGRAERVVARVGRQGPRPR